MSAIPYIEMRVNLDQDSRVVRVARDTKRRPLEIVGALWKFWSLAYMETRDGRFQCFAVEDLDRVTGIKGLGRALESVGWLEVLEGGSVAQPGFEDRIPRSAKAREDTNQRVRRYRASRRAKEINDKYAGGAPETPLVTPLKRYGNVTKNVTPAPHDLEHGSGSGSMEHGANGAQEPRGVAAAPPVCETPPSEMPWESTSAGPHVDARSAIFNAYPNQQARHAGMLAISTAAETIALRMGSDVWGGYVWLYGRVRAYAASGLVKSQGVKYVPQCKRWMDDARYDDKDEAWEAPPDPAASAPPRDIGAEAVARCRIEQAERRKRQAEQESHR